MAGLFDHPIVPPLRTVLANVRAGDLLIPEFQRPFVWSDEQRLNLLDSVARGLPIGALLVWQTKKSDHSLQTYSKLGPFELPERSESGPWSYLIDGHQRLTTLYAALTRYEGDWFERKTDERWPVYVDLELDPEGRFFVLPSRRELEIARSTLVPAWALTSNKLMYGFQKRLLDVDLEDESDRLEALANAFKDYPIPLIPMVTDDLSIVTRAFARVNTGGSTMSPAHLAAALAHGRIPLREELATLASEFVDEGWDVLDEGALLDLLKIRFGLDVYRSDIETLLRKLGAKTGDSRKLKRVLRGSRRSLRRAIDVLAAVPVLGSQALPYKFQLLVLAEVLRETSNDDEHEVRERALRWFWQTTFTEAFTGATGSRVRSAKGELLAFLNGEAELSMEGQEVRAVSRQQRWGAVRTLGRTLANLARAKGEAASHLAALGRKALHKYERDLDSGRPAAWFVGNRADVIQFAKWMGDEEDAEEAPQLLDQVDPGLHEALREEEWDQLLDGQDEYLFRVEREKIESVGLVLTD